MTINANGPFFSQWISEKVTAQADKVLRILQLIRQMQFIPPPLLQLGGVCMGWDMGMKQEMDQSAVRAGDCQPGETDFHPWDRNPVGCLAAPYNQISFCIGKLYVPFSAWNNYISGNVS